MDASMNSFEHFRKGSEIISYQVETKTSKNIKEELKN